MRDVIDGGDQYKKTTPQVSLGQVVSSFLDCLSGAEVDSFFSLKD